MKKLVIGQFSESFPPLMDGVGFVTKNYSSLLKEKGHEIWAVVSGSYADEGYAYDKEHGIDYTIRATMIPVYNIKPYGFVIKSREMRNKVRSIDFDIIHTHAPFFLGRFAEQLNRHKKIPLVSTFHSLYKDDFYGTLKSKSAAEYFTKRILKHYETADEVWTPTAWSRDKLYDYGLKNKEVIIVENGCDLPIPTEEQYRQSKAAGYKFLNVDSKTLLLLYIGQLKKEKNLELLIEALKITKDHNQNFKMVFVGSGPDRPHFEKMIASYGLEKHVIFTGAIKEREIIKNLLACAYLFMFPSQYDTSALVMYEASAYALALLNTCGSSTATRTKDGYNSFVAQNNARSYGEKIITLLKEPNHVKEVGLNAQKSIYRNWDAVVNEVENRYYDLYRKFN
ncbi:MAG: glycosyltransferase [Sphaerochaetaceae bacterium]